MAHPEFQPFNMSVWPREEGQAEQIGVARTPLLYSAVHQVL